MTAKEKARLNASDLCTEWMTFAICRQTITSKKIGSRWARRVGVVVA